MRYYTHILVWAFDRVINYRKKIIKFNFNILLNMFNLMK